MDYSTYTDIRQILMGIVLFLGVHMLFVGVTKPLKKSFYQNSMKVMGSAFLFVPLSCLLYRDSTQLDLTPHIATAINLTAYYASFALMSVAFLMLLGIRFSRWMMNTIIALIAIYPIPLWICVAIGDTDLIVTAITASYSFFVVMIIVTVSYILYRHRLATKNIDNYYSEDVSICVRWISKSIKMLIGLTLTCILAPVFFKQPRWLRFICMTYGSLCYIHIYYGYRRMLINLTEHFTTKSHGAVHFSIVETNIATEAPTMSADATQNIQSKLEHWVSEKLYIQPNITINDMAREINTNRTYLSKYINTTYGCSFRRWITQLRVEESKAMLLSNAEIPINNIAYNVGFASVESFSHSFSRIEGISPSKWREYNK